VTSLAVPRTRRQPPVAGYTQVVGAAEPGSPPRRAHALVVVTHRLPAGGAGDGLPGIGPGRPGGGLHEALTTQVQRHAGAWVGAPCSGRPGHGPVGPQRWAFDTVPVPLSGKEIAEYDTGMADATLWPLYHAAVGPAQFRRSWWNAYVAVNRRFAEAAQRHAAPEATVWVHGFRLHLVPAMLRRRRPDLAIGFTSRLPFPPYEIFSRLPWRTQLLKGLAGADLLGLPRPAHVENLVRAAHRTGLRGAFVPVPAGAGRGSPSGGRTPPATRISVFPGGVGARGLDAAAQDPAVMARAAQLRAELGSPRTVLLAVDPLDGTRGVLHRLEAVEAALGSGRLDAAETAYVQVAVPARRAADTDLRERVESAVARINGTYARIGRPVVHYLHRDLPPTELIALYLASDALLATPLSDGASQTAQEYVACRHDERGVLVLSEFSGTSDHLTQALIVNPHDQEAFQEAILRATTLPAEEAGGRMRAMRRTVFAHDAQGSATDFLDALAEAGRWRRAVARQTG
jgi:trehalose 6-phosphate synthase